MIREKGSAEDMVMRAKAETLVAKDDLGTEELLQGLLPEEGDGPHLPKDHQESVMKAWEGVLIWY